MANVRTEKQNVSVNICERIKCTCQRSKNTGTLAKANVE